MRVLRSWLLILAVGLTACAHASPPRPRRIFFSSASVLAPNAIPGLVGWWRSGAGYFQDSAKTTAATADGDPVGCWADQSGLVHDLKQTTTTKRPLLRLLVKNGKSTVRFDGVDDFLTAGFTLSQPVTVAFAATRTGGSATSWYVDGGGGVANVAILNRQDAVTLRMFAVSGTYNIGVLSLDAWHAFVGTFSASASVTSVDGADTYGSVTTSSPGGLLVAEQQGGGHMFGGDFLEIAEYNRALIPNERAGLSRYLRKLGGW